TMSPGPNLTASGPATVTDAALSVVTSPNVTGTAGQPLGLNGPVLLATFADANPYATTADFTATIAWGDGSVDSGTVQAGTQGNFDVLGNHTYADGGSYIVQVTLLDDGGSSATATGTAAIDLIEGQPACFSLLVSPVSGTDLSSDENYTATLDF